MANKNDKTDINRNIYLDELDSISSVTEEERLKIINDVYKDKNKASEVIPMLFLKDVVDIARLYEGQGVLFEDLYGEGNIALLMGSRNLDLCDSASEVEEFLTKTVMDAMEKIISEQAIEEDVDKKIAESVNNVYEAAKELSETLMRKITISELALEMEVDESTIYEAIRLSGNQIEYIEGDNDENQ